MTSMQSWFIQLIGLVGSVIAITSLQSGSRKKILSLQVVCCVLWVTHYGLLGAWTGALINCLGLARAVVCACNDRKWAKSPLWLVFFLVCYAVSPLLTWDGTHCLLMGGAMMLTTVALWVRDMRLTRLLFLLNSPLVLLYNLAAGSYSCAAIEVVALASFALAVWRFDIRKQPCKT
ncbi:YgjV family protein [Oscillibacter sp.]|uniref:YgjV family protein n=1 Tax=Oscillibacter sp. TaxID=1945593 RepID=UPI002DB85FD0|nr:YgjV family protein [Oscillibacter sp.]